MRPLTAALLALGLAACGLMPTADTQRYTVTTSLMQKPGELPRACSGMALPLPPIGCGGADIVGVDLQTLPDARRYSNGVISAGTYRLVGTWEHGALHLVEPPAAAVQTAATPLPNCAQSGYEGSPTDVLQGQRLMADEDMLNARGIVVLQFYMCQADLFVVVAVADATIVDFMQSRYAPVKVAGWLQTA